MLTKCPRCDNWVQYKGKRRVSMSLAHNVWLTLFKLCYYTVISLVFSTCLYLLSFTLWKGCDAGHKPVMLLAFWAMLLFAIKTQLLRFTKVSIPPVVQLECEACHRKFEVKT